jgi:hypothetical protein
MNRKLAVLAVLALSVGLIGNAYAHKEQVIGDYKMKVGWKIEPPIAGKKNAIEITVIKASTTDKKTTKDAHQDHPDDAKSQDTKKDTKTSSKTTSSKTTHGHGKKTTGITGLDKSLEVDVTLNGKKTFLKLVEDKKNKGTYHAEFTPDAEGHPTVHVVGKIKTTLVEITFHPEKVEAKTK